MVKILFKKLDEEIENIKDFKKVEKSFLKISLCLRLKAALCKKSLTEKDVFFMKMFDKSQNIINDKMDMINYLKFFDEHINIKCLLFNEVQSLCLNFTEKPKLYVKNHYNDIMNSDYKSIKEITEYFVNKTFLPKTDKDIFDLLSKKIQNIIIKNNQTFKQN